MSEAYAIPTHDETARRDRITSALWKFICQRPGLEPGNYATGADYLAEARRISRDRRVALQLFYAVNASGHLSADYLTGQTGRLTWDSARGEWEYVTGQYFPVEYRPAAARLLASALWQYWRDHCGCDTADKIRAEARRTFRSAAVRRYFV